MKKPFSILLMIMIITETVVSSIGTTETAVAKEKDATRLTVSVNANKVTLKWKKIKGVKKYRVVYNGYYKKGWKKAKDTKSLSCTVKLKYTTPYKIRIECPDNKGGLHSNTVNFETGSNPSLNYSRVCSLKSYKVNKYYNAACTPAIVFAGDDLCYLKCATTAGDGAPYRDYYPMVIGRIKDFSQYSKTQNPPATFTKITKKDGSLYYASHASSMEYVDGYFYIVTCGNPDNECPLIKVNSSGVVEEEIFMETESDNSNKNAFSTIAYVGDDESGNPCFVGRLGKSNRTYRNGSVYSEDNMVSQVLRAFVVKNRTIWLSDFRFSNDQQGALTRLVVTQDLFTQDTHCNDVCYDQVNDIFYLSTFVYDSGSKNITKNNVYGYGLKQYSERVSEYVSLASKYSSAFDLTSSRNTAETKFEVEGMAVHEGRLYLGVNTNGIEDALYVAK